MLNANPEELKIEFLAMKLSRMQNLIDQRAKFCSQKEAARAFGCSERKIQMFENYKCTDPYLIWCYRKYFKNKK
jgi:hypothetical protein